MNCFQLIKTVLDEAYSEIQGDRDAAIKLEMEALTAEYKNLKTKGCLDYSNPARRFAYLFTYTTSHAHIVYERIARSADLAQVFDAKQVFVSCIGGGPGSDFLGVLKYCQLAKKTPGLTCHLLDRDAAWGESWSDVGKKVGATMRLDTVFSPFDVTDEARWKVFKKHFQADFFTLIYFVSEVYEFREKAAPYFDALFSSMRADTHLLYVDNNTPEFYKWFDALAAKHGLQIVESNSGHMQLAWNGKDKEEKADLQPYLDRFRSPKLGADVAWRVLRK